ncbi:hypothetical protein [Flavobacterium aestivum]|uniref:hypothetical protein n=1 Tax=Flavobacterium aestivum TaxID=3003257 RepID=UPI002285EB34|nr:hypothetical protein [Flavobacterium aestivum]
MKKVLIFLTIVFIVSCHTDKKTKSTICVESIKYYEPLNDNLGESPAVTINIKVEDSSVCKKLEGGKLKELLIFSIKKEDKLFIYYQTHERLFRSGNTFSFLIRTSYFKPNVLNNRKTWKSDEIIKALNGDIGLVFDNDTIRVGSCKDRKFIIQTIK